MRHLIFMLTITVCFAAQAQAPEAFKFQAVIHSSDGTLLTNKNISVRISILQGSVSGTAVYVETHATITNANGVVNLAIGNGSVQSGTFADIKWSADDYFVKTEMDPNGGSSYSDIGTSQLLSVPYALDAKNAESAAGWKLSNDITYDSGKVSIGSDVQESESALSIHVELPDSELKKSNGLFLRGYDVNSRGIPLWIRTNSEDLFFGTGVGQTQGRMLRMEDKRSPGGNGGSFDLGLGEFGDFFIQGTGFATKSFSIGSNGKVGILNDNPSSELDVNGNIAASGTVLTRQLNLNGILINQELGNIGVDKENPQYKLDVEGAVNAAGFLVNGVPLTPGSGSSQWVANGNDISYTQGHVNIGTNAPETPSGLYVSVPTPTSQHHANGFFLKANDVNSQGFPLWLQSNTSSLTYGWNEGQTQGRLLRLQDVKYGFDAIWDFGIDTRKSLFIIGGNDHDFSRKFTITTDGNVGIGTETPHAKLEVDGGDLYINNNTSGFSGVILKSPAGSCFRVTVSDTGQLVSTAVPCPN